MGRRRERVRRGGKEREGKVIEGGRREAVPSMFRPYFFTLWFYQLVSVIRPS